MSDLNSQFYVSAVEWLRQEIGLEAESIGRMSLEAAITKAMKIAGIKPEFDFNPAIKSMPFCEALLETSIIPETWFFRDGQSYELLSSLLNDFEGKKMKILSAPCSTGEEPYSVAMVLDDFNINKAEAEIIAVDISNKSIEYALGGIYSGNSFRDFNFEKWGKNFDSHGKLFKIHDNIKDYVKFFRYNLINPEFHNRFGRFNLIFSKNVLIYLNNDARRIYLNNIKKCLYPGGMLFCGLSEVNYFLLNGFEKVSHRYSFACKLKSEDILQKKKSIDKLIKNDFHPYKIINDTKLPLPPVNKPIVRENTPSPVVTIESIKKIANEGNFLEALEKCKIYADVSPDAEVFFLGGVICEALDRSNEAEVWYLKAAYLNPSHYEALSNLALYYEKHGDTTKSNLYRSRAKRAFESRSEK